MIEGLPYSLNILLFTLLILGLTFGAIGIGITWIVKRQTGPWWKPIKGSPAIVAGLFLILGGLYFLYLLLPWFLKKI